VRVAKISTTALAAVVLCGGCSTKSDQKIQPSSPAETPVVSANASDVQEAYAVYNALLRPPKSNKATSSGDSIVIEEHSSVEKLCFDPTGQSNPRLREAAKDYEARVSEPVLLAADKFNLGRSVEIISAIELNSIFADGAFAGWKKFRESYSGIQSYLEVSRLGFSADRKFAIVYSAVHCGPKCGAGGFVTLSRIGGVWRKNSDRLCSWIS
jgi:hypothetical protein